MYSFNMLLKSFSAVSHFIAVFTLHNLALHCSIIKSNFEVLVSKATAAILFRLLLQLVKVRLLNCHPLEFSF